MVDFDYFYKRVTGISKGWGSWFGFSRFVGSGLHKRFVRSRHARLRSGIGVLSLAGVIFYISNKDLIEARVENFHKGYVERLDDARLRREARVLLKEEIGVEDRLVQLSSRLSYLDNKLLFLENKEDSLSGVISVLERDVLVAQNDLNAYRNNVGVVASEELVVDKYKNINEFKGGSSGSLVLSDKSVNKENARSNVVKGGVYWVGVPAGGNLSGLASKYYGSNSLFKGLAEFNDLSNPDFVLRGQPIKFFADDLVCVDGLVRDEFPSFVQVKRGEFLDDFLSRINVSVSKSVVVDYNVVNGNLISDNDLLIKNTDVVYLKNDWLN